MSLTLLITAAGTGTGFSYAQAKARWFPEIRLLTGDIYSKEQITASLQAVEKPPRIAAVMDALNH